MKIRIHDTDFEGHLLDCSGDYFTGETALDIVEAMTLNPFQSHLTPHKFMEQTLATIGEKSFSLPEDPETAALAFLQKLTALGTPNFPLTKENLTRSILLPQVQLITKNICKINLDNKGLPYWLCLHSSGIVCVVKGGVRSLAERRK